MSCGGKRRQNALLRICVRRACTCWYVSVLMSCWRLRVRRACTRWYVSVLVSCWRDAYLPRLYSLVCKPTDVPPRSHSLVCKPADVPRGGCVYARLHSLVCKLTNVLLEAAYLPRLHSLVCKLTNALLEAAYLPRLHSLVCKPAGGMCVFARASAVALYSTTRLGAPLSSSSVTHLSISRGFPAYPAQMARLHTAENV